MKLILVVKRGAETIKDFPGLIDLSPHLPIGEIEAIPELEQALERLLGYRFHIMELHELHKRGEKE